ncbi:MAG TPA: hypothetical protein VGE97_08195, partial [Nitrososphaera sp.]
QTCPPLPIDANGRCPGIDVRGGGLGLPPVQTGQPPPLSPEPVKKPECVGEVYFDVHSSKCVSANIPQADGKCVTGYEKGTANSNLCEPVGFHCPANTHVAGYGDTGGGSCVNNKNPLPRAPGEEDFVPPTCAPGLMIEEDGCVSLENPTPTTQTDNTGGTTPPTTQDGGHILINPNDDGTCPAGSHKFGAVCEKDTLQSISGVGGSTTPGTRTTTTTTTPTAQDGHILIMPNADDTCPTGSHKFGAICEKDTVPPTSDGGATTTPASNEPPLTPQQQYEACLKGIGGDIPGNCKPPSATITEQNVAPLETLTPQQICKDGSIPAANGICQDGSTPQQACQGGEVLDAKGGCLSPGVASSIKNGTLIPLGNGKFKLATAPPVPNTNSIAPICPVGFHLALSKCVVNSGGCPSGTVQDDDMCSPSQAHYNIPSNVAKLQDGTCPSGYHSTDVQCEINSQQKLPNGMCPDGTVLTTDDRCVTMPVLPGTTTGSGGGFIQMFPIQTTPALPPATSPTNTPPRQP